VITASPAVRYLGLIHESALRMQVGGPHVAKAQLNRLLGESERTNVTLLVIPFSAGGFAMAGDSVMYVAAHSPHLDTVQVDSPIGAVYFDSPAQLANFRRRLDSAELVALNSHQSRDAILDIIKKP
jgi:hypothetical protein